MFLEECNKLTKRQEEIIKASIDIISEKGIQHLTIKNLARSIGISEPAIYRHFESKMEILISILNKFESYIKSEKEIIAREDISSIDKIGSIFSYHFLHFKENPAFAAVIFSEEIFRDEKRLSDKVFSIISSNFEMVRVIVRNGQKKNEIRTDIDKEQITDIIMGALRLIVKKWRLSNRSFNIEIEGMKLWDSIKMMITDNL